MRVIDRGAWWDGIPATGNAQSFIRSSGVESDVCLFRVSEDMVASSAVKFDPFRFVNLNSNPVQVPAGAAALGDDFPALPPSPRDLPSVGDLVYAEMREDGDKRTTVQTMVKSMFLTEVQVEDAGKEPRELVLVLQDERIYWRGYAEFTGEFNTPVLDTASQVRTSLKHIFRALLRRLPGAPILAHWPEGFSPRPPRVRAYGADVKNILSRLLDSFGLILSLHFDRTVGIYLRGAGVVGESAGSKGPNVTPHDFGKDKGVWAGEIPTATNRLSGRLSDVPHQVLIVGSPMILTATVDYLTPIIEVEEIDERGRKRRKIVDATKEALDKISGVETEGQEYLELALGANPEALTGVSPAAKRLIRSQFLRRWRLPKAFHHLLPALDRAERYVDTGDRMPPLVEAFGYESVPVRAFSESGEGIPIDRRTFDEFQLDEVESEIARVTGEISRLEWVKLSEVQEAIDGLTRSARAAEFELLTEQSVPAAQLEREGDTSILSNLVTEAQLTANALGLGFQIRTDNFLFKVTAEGVQVEGELVTDKIIDSLKRAGLRAIGEYSRLDDKAALDPTGAFVEQLRKRLEALKKEQVKLLKKTNPIAGLEASLALATKAYEDAERASNTDSSEVHQRDEEGRSKARAIEEQIQALRDEKEETQRENQRPVFTTAYANQARGPVEARIDRVRGIVVLSKPSAWLMDPTVSDPKNTVAIPMPPRITFGTINGKTLAVEGDPLSIRLEKVGAAETLELVLEQIENAYMRGSMSGILATGGLQGFFNGLGHTVPLQAGFRPLRLTFSEDDRSGGADKLPLRAYATERETKAGWASPFRVLDPTLQLLVRLPVDVGNGVSAPESNATDVLERAQALAAAVLDRPRERPGGDFVVLGPRPVVPNGIISAVEISLRGHPEGGMETLVSLESEEAPLVDVLRPKQTQEAQQFVFGLDVESIR